ncbi:MAG: VCBS repeat-containing protein [Kiritimatiellaeota bacterium]|nr:VCBS repeat-containing protein [Kiritimatiellota bacterium]
MKKMTTLCAAAMCWCCAGFGWANTLDWGVVGSVWSNHTTTVPLTASTPAADGSSWLVQLIWAGPNGQNDTASQIGDGTTSDDVVMAYSWIGFGVPDALAQGRWNNTGLNGYNNTLSNGTTYFIRVWEGAALNGNGSVPTNYTYYGDSALYVITNFDIGLSETFEPNAQPNWTPIPAMASRSYTVNVVASPTNSGTVSGGGFYLVNSDCQIAAASTPGWAFTSWNDGNLQNPRTITVPPSNVTYTATFTFSPLSLTLGKALNATNLVWQTGGFGNWSPTTAVSHDGQAVQSGAVYGSQYSWIQTIVKGPGSLSFWWKISSESTDALRFTVNGQLQAQIVTSTDWQQYVLFLGSTNAYTLRWTFAKNTFSSAGSDAGWVDQVTWSPCPYAEHVPQIFYQDPGGTLVSWVLGTNGGFRFARLLANTGSWALKAAGDIDGDGVSDLLFQSPSGDTVGWFMNADGSMRTARYWFNIVGWEVKACGDYEGLTGRGQVFFQNARGEAVYWRLETNGTFQSAVYLGNMGPWKLRGAGDLDGDGKAELFWQNAAGTLATWNHNPDGSIRASVPYTTGSWALCSVMDLNLDGVSDLIWQTPDGDIAGWLMNSNGTFRAPSYWWNTGSWKLKAAGR